MRLIRYCRQERDLKPVVVLAHPLIKEDSPLFQSEKHGGKAVSWNLNPMATCKNPDVKNVATVIPGVGTTRPFCQLQCHG
jgi:hypothetical protein